MEYATVAPQTISPWHACMIRPLNWPLQPKNARKNRAQRRMLTLSKLEAAGLQTLHASSTGTTRIIRSSARLEIDQSTLRSLAGKGNIIASND
ncbi:MAG: hypothetical protein AB9869_08145 [Verrucomicrobiia bacterium]